MAHVQVGEGDHDPEALRWAQEALYQEELRRASLAEPNSNGWEQEARYQEELRRAAFADPNSHSHLADHEALITFESIYRNSRSDSTNHNHGNNRSSWNYDPSSSSSSSSGNSSKSSKSKKPAALPVFASSFSEPGYWRVGSSTTNSRFGANNNSHRKYDNSSSSGSSTSSTSSTSSSSSSRSSSSRSSRSRSVTSSDTYTNSRSNIKVGPTSTVSHGETEAKATTTTTSSSLLSFAGVRGVGNHSGVEPGYVPKHHHPSELAQSYSLSHSAEVENGYNSGGGGGVTYVKSWRLNERHYGALQGLEKNDPALTEAHGEAQVSGDWLYF